MDDIGNKCTVFVVQYDNGKDFSDAKRFGNLKAVFTNPRKPYDTYSMIAKARSVLAEYKPGDSLLMVGDPTLCSVCLALVCEVSDVISVLNWDRSNFSYISQRWDFSQHNDFATADDNRFNR